MAKVGEVWVVLNENDNRGIMILGVSTSLAVGQRMAITHAVSELNWTKAYSRPDYYYCTDWYSLESYCVVKQDVVD